MPINIKLLQVAKPWSFLRVFEIFYNWISLMMLIENDFCLNFRNHLPNQWWLDRFLIYKPIVYYDFNFESDYFSWNLISKNHYFANNIFNYYPKHVFPSFFSCLIGFDQVKERNYRFKNTFVLNDFTVIALI